MEPLAGGLAYFRCQLQIVVSTGYICMAKISRQVRQSRLYVRALGIPALQDICGKTVTQIMNARWMPTTVQQVGADTQLMPDSHESMIGVSLVPFDPIAQEECFGGDGTLHFASSLKIQPDFMCHRR